MRCFARRRETEVGFSQSLLRRSSLMRRDPSCCWDYDGVSQCNSVWLAKTHVLVSGDTEILQRFRVLNKSSNRKYDFLAIYSSSKFFLQAVAIRKPDFTPPMNNLKPVKRLDHDAYENFTTV